MSDFSPELERLASMNDNDLKSETNRLRGVVQMTTYKGAFIPKGGLQRKGEADDDDKKKKMILVVLGSVFAYFVYANLM